MWNTLKRIAELLGILTVPRLRERHVVRLSKALDKAVNEVEWLQAELVAIIEATEQDGCDTALEAVKQLREQTDTMEWREAYSDDAFEALKAKLQRVQDHNQTITEGYKQEIAALRERAAVPSVDPSPEQVEALARVLHEAEPSMPPATYRERNEALARAAIAHLRKRPEELPTAEQLKAAYREYYESFGGMSGALCATDFALQHLAPWLRDPVGWELDVTAEQLVERCYGNSGITLHPSTAAEMIDWFRSRIRTTYECKECAELKQKLHHVAVAWNAVRNAETIDALDDALAGVGVPDAPPADEVEALARVLRDEHAKVMGTDALSYGRTLFCAYARAAIAHLRKRPEGE